MSIVSPSPEPPAPPVPAPSSKDTCIKLHTMFSTIVDDIGAIAGGQVKKATKTDPA